MRPNPYKRPGSECLLHKISADVSEEDFYYFVRALGALRGTIDQSVSKLFKALVDEMREQEIPDYYLPENEPKIEGILRGITFTRTPRDQREHTDSGGSTHDAERSAGATHQSSETSVQEVEGVQQAYRQECTDF